MLFLPALAGELFWSAELLVAIGSTLGVLLGMPLTTAILLSAAVTTAYTVPFEPRGLALVSMLYLVLSAVVAVRWGKTANRT